MDMFWQNEETLRNSFLVHADVGYKLGEYICYLPNSETLQIKQKRLPQSDVLETYD